MEGRDISASRPIPVDLRGSGAVISVVNMTETVTLNLTKYENMKLELDRKAKENFEFRTKIEDLERIIEELQKEYRKCFDILTKYSETFINPIIDFINVENDDDKCSMDTAKKILDLVKFDYRNSKRKSGIVPVYSWKIEGPIDFTIDPDKEWGDEYE